MAGCIENLQRAPHLDDSPGVHHRHPVGIRGDNTEVVRHQYNRYPRLLLDLFQEIEVLRLDGDV
jgi:hypothetical protein